MNPLSDDCFAYGGELIKATDALAELADRVHCIVGIESVPLSRAHGRFLAEAVTSARDVPGFANAAMDGYALNSCDLGHDGETRLRVSDRSAAGKPAECALGPGEAVRIFTGAMMPKGADAVVMQEDCRRDGDWVIVPGGVKAGINWRKAGEDIPKDAVVLEAGGRLRPQDIGIAASVGCGSLRVFRRLRVALFSTGDELREPDQPLPPGGVYDSNRYMLDAMLAEMGCEVSNLGILPDSEDAVRDALVAAAADHHVVVTSGGASQGEEDHVVPVLKAIGNVHLWRLAIKPGRPVAFGQIGAAVFVGLPGNPVAAALCLLRFARPALGVLAGGKWHDPVTYPVKADFDFSKKPNRREWLRATLITGEGGGKWVRRFPREGSGILTSLTESDGFIELSEDLTGFRRGELVDFLPFSELGIMR
ncbi:MAG: gephyrin-like molybdotransferase Glp [Alphaproteobacteria bacterium]